MDCDDDYAFGCVFPLFPILVSSLSCNSSWSFIFRWATSLRLKWAHLLNADTSSPQQQQHTHNIWLEFYNCRCYYYLRKHFLTCVAFFIVTNCNDRCLRNVTCLISFAWFFIFFCCRRSFCSYESGRFFFLRNYKVGLSTHKTRIIGFNWSKVHSKLANEIDFFFMFWCIQ